MPVAVEQAGNFGAPSKQTKQNNEQRFSESAVPPTRMRARCSWFLKGRPKSRRVPQCPSGPQCPTVGPSGPRPPPSSPVAP